MTDSDGKTSTRMANFVEGSGTFQIAKTAAEVLKVALLDQDGQPVPATFDAVDREDYAGVSTVTVRADVGNGEHSVQVVVA